MQKKRLEAQTPGELTGGRILTGQPVQVQSFPHLHVPEVPHPQSPMVNELSSVGLSGLRFG